MSNSTISIDINNPSQLNALARITTLQTKQASNQHLALQKGNIVLCDFIGFGEELDFPHFAIVWKSEQWSNNINIIPMTSKFKNESKFIFNIGKIPNFITKCDTGFIHKDSFVYINKMTEVSKSRVRVIYQQDISGNKLLDSKGRPIPIKLPDDDMHLVSQYIKLYYAEEGTCIVDLILKSTPDNFVDLNNIDENIFNIGYRLVESYTENLLDNGKVFNLSINNSNYSVPLIKINWSRFNSTEHRQLYSNIKYHKNFGSRKQNIINGLFSKDPLKVNEAKKIINDLYIG